MSDDVATEVRPRAETRPRGTTWVGLVGVELRRLWWRRLTKVVLLAIVAFVGLSTVQVYQQTNPEVIAQRLEEFNRYAAEVRAQQASLSAEEKAQQIATCRADQESARQSDPRADFRCDEQFAPTLAGYGLVEAARSQLVGDAARALLYLLGFLAFLLGASSVAAEMTTGSMGNWLTFEPRRLRVATTKLAAATLGGLGVAVAGIALITLAVVGVTTLNRPGESVDLPDAPPSTDGPVSLLLLRVVVAVALGGLGGAVLGLLVRSTAAVVGVVLGYAVVVEGFVANGIQDGRLQPWFLRLNIDSFVGDCATYVVRTCGLDGCQGSALTNSYTHGWVYLLAVAVVGVVADLLVFRRRDVG
jgi:ABC-2 type transport system permease protein